jgi:hypothetical protein
MPYRTVLLMWYNVGVPVSGANNGLTHTPTFSHGKEACTIQFEKWAGTGAQFNVQGRLDSSMPWRVLNTVPVETDKILYNIPLCPEMRIRMTAGTAVQFAIKLLE